VNLSLIINGILNDKDWLNKLLITLIITAVSLLLTPVLIGLVGWAILFGYQIEIVRNVRLGDETPLPAWWTRSWNEIQRLLTPGANALLAFLIYNIPNLVLGCGWFFVVTTSSGAALVGSSVMLASICCLLPLMLVYNAVMLPFFTVGMGRYTDDPRINAFFGISEAYDYLAGRLSDTILFLAYALIIALITIGLMVIPVIGWIIFSALIIPVTALLGGQYARLILGAKAKPKPEKRKPKPPSSAPRPPQQNPPPRR
jgi:hypothetical protein